MEKNDYNVGDIYQGSPSTFKPGYAIDDLPSNYPVQAGDIGMATFPQTANVLKEVTQKINSGAKNLEVTQPVQMQIFDSIPKQHLEELNRMAKLTGVDLSLHGPVIDTVGIDQRSGLSEMNREASERKIVETLERSKLVNPKGMSVTFHAAEGIPNSDVVEKEVNGEKREVGRIFVVNRTKGSVSPIELEPKYYPGRNLDEGTWYNVEQEIKSMNGAEWDNELSGAIFQKQSGDELIDKYYDNYLKSLPLIQGKSKKEISKPLLEVHERMRVGTEYLKQAELTARSMFNRAYKLGTEEQKKKLQEISKNYKKELFGFETDEQLKRYEEGKLNRTEQEIALAHTEDPRTQSRAIQRLMEGLNAEEIVPQNYMKVEDFATEQSSKTFGNAAFKIWKESKNKKNLPIVNIENPPAGFGLSTGKQLKRLVEESRNKFVEQATKEGLSKEKARKEAERLIGATWDVGHINMLRGQGKGEKEILEETEAIAPYVKHVHLSDNFGFEHTELPMGMGNVPMGKIMKKLGKQGYKAKKIIEAASWWQHFGNQGANPPLQQTLEAFGSPIYAAKMSPGWGAAMNIPQGYYGGYGMMLPSSNYEMFGAGYSPLPMELGGQRPGASGSRMSGRPME